MSRTAEIIKTKYDLTRKGRQFILGEEQQIAFEEIKSRLVKPPVLHPPDNEDRFHSYSDTTTFDTGRDLYQIQNGNQS